MILSERKKWILSIFISFMILFLLLLSVEGAVRIRQFIKYGSSGRMDDMYTYDAKLDLRVPVANYRTKNISINSLGFRGPEIESPKPVNRVRVAFIGASTTFCAEVSGNEYVWPHIVVEKLRKRYRAKTFDYINAGVPGYSVESSLKNLTKRVAVLQPDIVVIYHATNDLSYETRQLARKAGLFNKEKVEELNWLSEKSMLWYLIEKNLQLKITEMSVSAKKERLVFNPNKLGGEFRTDFISLIKESKKVADTVAVATFSHQIREEQSDKEMLNASSSALYYMPYMDPKGLIKAFKQYNKIIEQTSMQEGVLLIANEEFIPGDSIHFNDTVHFRDAGSSLMAERVFKGLIGKLDI